MSTHPTFANSHAMIVSAGARSGRRAASRSGVILIIVAGICAILITTALAFIVRMRSAEAESQVLLRYTQARCMLFSACNYLLEGGRVGWEGMTPAGQIDDVDQKEAFGWQDVRDGKPGPKRVESWSAYIGQGTGRYPDIGGRAARCPMLVRRMPPYAVSMAACPNPILTPANQGWYPQEVARGRRPFDIVLCDPDPWPAAMDAGANDPRTWTWKKKNPGEAANQRLLWTEGLPEARPESADLSWFRVYRDDVTTFVLTCGAGGTEGFKDWSEVVAEGRQEAFYDDKNLFENLLADEVRLWYRVGWSPAISPINRSPSEIVEREFPRMLERYSDDNVRASAYNVCGSIAWVQRLRQTPLEW